MIRVLVAEDSLTLRDLLVEILTSDPNIQVVGAARNGAEAVELAARLQPDLITMDIHMPIMDGLEATKEIMAMTPTPILIVSSSTSREDMHLSFDAMRVGALMVTPKPDDPHSAQFEDHRQQFLSMARAMSQVKVVRRWPDRGQAARPLSQRPDGAQVPTRVVALGASTGGPAALQRILCGLPRDFPAPILVVQHIAPGFVQGFAAWLSSSCSLRVKVAEAGEALAARSVLLAPEDRHLGVTRDARVILADSPPINGFRPSASYLFESAGLAFGASVTAVILTGMGDDGVEGLRVLKAARGRVLAQDEASSVVYGMPGEAVRAGVVDAIVPLDEIALRLSQMARPALSLEREGS